MVVCQGLAMIRATAGDLKVMGTDHMQVQHMHFVIFYAFQSPSVMIIQLKIKSSC